MRPDPAAALSAPQVAALGYVGRIMQTAQNAWCLTGSMAAALLGAEVAPQDIDILTSVADARRIVEAEALELQPDPGTDLFRSRIHHRWRHEGVALDLMAGFEVKTAQGWQPVAPDPQSLCLIGGTELWLPAASALIAVYQTFDRPKDQARIAALRRL